jgi:hypothetical protein
MLSSRTRKAAADADGAPRHRFTRKWRKVIRAANIKA